MKRNGIIYPNTPYFRKFGGKLIMPAGAEEEGGGSVFEMIPSEYALVISGSNYNPLVGNIPAVGGIISFGALMNTGDDPWEKMEVSCKYDGETRIFYVAEYGAMKLTPDIIASIPEEYRGYYQSKLGAFLVTLYWEDEEGRAMEGGETVHVYIAYEDDIVWEGDCVVQNIQP